MIRFSYQLRPTRVIFGEGAVADTGAELSRAGLTRGFVVCTPGRAADLALLQGALGSSFRDAFTTAMPHVPSSTVAEARARLRAAGADCCISLGGGSATGLGKALALESGLPLVAVPTTYSGSEMTDIWGITDGDTKRVGRNPQAAPRVVVYDPELSRDLPARLSAASGMNGAAHAVEALYAPDANPITSLAGERALRLFASALPRIVAAPRDRGARTDALQAAHLAGVALSGTSMGLHHKLCHVLGGTFGLPHAETHAALLPYVVAFNGDYAPAAMAAVAAAMGAEDPARGLETLTRRLGLTRSLRDLGLRGTDVDRAAGLATDTALANPRPVTRDAVRALLQRAYEGGGVDG